MQALAVPCAFLGPEDRLAFGLRPDDLEYLSESGGRIRELGSSGVDSRVYQSGGTCPEGLSEVTSVCLECAV